METQRLSRGNVPRLQYQSRNARMPNSAVVGTPCSDARKKSAESEMKSLDEQAKNLLDAMKVPSFVRRKAAERGLVYDYEYDYQQMVRKYDRLMEQADRVLVASGKASLPEAQSLTHMVKSYYSTNSGFLLRKISEVNRTIKQQHKTINAQLTNLVALESKISGDLNGVNAALLKRYAIHRWGNDGQAFLTRYSDNVKSDLRKDQKAYNTYTLSEDRDQLKHAVQRGKLAWLFRPFNREKADLLERKACFAQCLLERYRERDLAWERAYCGRYNGARAVEQAKTLLGVAQRYLSNKSEEMTSTLNGLYNQAYYYSDRLMAATERLSAEKSYANLFTRKASTNSV